MIIIGYQGIGKSTCSKKSDKCIGLESTCFRNGDYRPIDWYVYYCQTAVDLSRQGYVVFTSSHKEVRKWFADNWKSSDVAAVVPSLSLKYAWLCRLSQRYLNSGLAKDYRAYKNAEDRYEENINEIMSDTYTFTIENTDYDLLSIVDAICDIMKVRYMDTDEEQEEEL